MAEKKNTIYLDIDEDITELVGKVQASKQDIVALVLPKRAAVMQSIVNVRLLARAAKQNDKNIVLITSDSTIISHAGEVGIYVADNLTAKPYLPKKTEPAPEVEDDPAEEELEIDQVAPVAAAAVAAGVAKGASASSRSPKAAKAGGKKSKIKIPDFGRFRKWLIGGSIGAIAFIAFIIWAIFFAGSATVAIKTNTTEKTANINVKLDTKADEVDVDTMTVPAKNEELRATETAKAPATGSKDKGAKASGSVKMTVKACAPNLGQPSDIPAGTGVSANGMTFITQSTASFDDDTASGSCVTYSAGNINIVAQQNGAQYNVGSSNFTVAGFNNVTAQGSTSGGSSEVVKVITQSDIDNAKAKALETQKNAKDDLKKALEKGDYLPIEESFTSKESDVKTNPAVGAEASEVSVTMTITSSMVGVKEDDLKKIIDKEYEQELKDAGAGISDYGLSQARFTPEKDNKSVSIQTTISIGPKVDENEIKGLVAGKKSGEAEEILKTKDGIVEVQVKVKPFWKTKVPKKEKKIKVTIEKK